MYFLVLVFESFYSSNINYLWLPINIYSRWRQCSGRSNVSIPPRYAENSAINIFSDFSLSTKKYTPVSPSRNFLINSVLPTLRRPVSTIIEGMALRSRFSSWSSSFRLWNFMSAEAVQQLLSVTNLLLLFRFKAPIRLFFLWILNYWTASAFLCNYRWLFSQSLWMQSFKCEIVMQNWNVTSTSPAAYTPHPQAGALTTYTVPTW